MSKRMLPPEIVSLIHHVELNQSGWWRRSACQIVKGLLLRAGNPLQPDALAELFKSDLGLHVHREQFDRNIDALLSAREVVKLPDGCLKLSEEASERLASDIQKAESEQRECRDLFCRDVSESCAGLDPEKVWDAFSQELAATIRILGANSFHMLVDGRLEKEVDWLEKLLGQFPDHRDGLNVAIRQFFDPNRRACRSQVLRLMSAYFFAEASQLSQPVIDSIEAQRKRKSIKVLLDTNFIFSLLGLHDNPANESVASILDIAKENIKSVDVAFYVLPATLAEATKSISLQLRKIEDIRVTKAMYGATQKIAMSSISSTYFEAASRTSGLTPAEYFQPYIDDLGEILRGRGIKVLEEQLGSWSSRQEVVDDLSDEMAREATYPEQKRKGYDQILHDVVLWHVASARRVSGRVSPLDIDAWVISIDWRLIGFDRRKRRDDSPIPVVLYPTNFLQLLQFWVPRTEKLESGLIDSMRLPLYFHRFDAEDESTTFEVLKVISRYENGGEFTEELISRILANRALRSRIHDASDDAVRQADLIREELISEVARENDIRKRRELELSDAKRIVEVQESDLLEKDEALGGALAERDALGVRIDELEDARRLASERADQEEDKRSKAEGWLALEKRAHAREGFVWKALIAPIFAILIAASPAWSLLHDTTNQYGSWVPLLLFVGLGFLIVGSWLAAITWYAMREVALRDWWVVNQIRWIYKVVFVGLGGIVIQGLIQSGAYDLLKQTLVGNG